MAVYSFEMREKVVNDYKNSSCSVASIAKKYGISTTTLNRWIGKDRQGTLAKNNYFTPKKVPDSTDWKIVERYRTSNLPIRSIASEFGVSSNYVYRALARCGVKLEKRQVICPDVKRYAIQDSVLADYATGEYGYRGLAAKYGVSVRTIQRIIKGLK